MCLSRLVSNSKGYWRAGTNLVSSLRVQFLKSDLFEFCVWRSALTLAKAYFEALQVTPISLSVIDVLTSLQTGLIDTVYASPLGAIALQWFTKVKYMTALPISNATGAIVVSKKTFDRLTPDNSGS